MRFYQKYNENYESRKTIFNDISSIQSLIDRYVTLEPHCFLHIGFLSNLFADQKLNESNVLSIGIYVMKEITLARLNDLKFYVVDIDSQAINSCIEFNRKLVVFIQYFLADIESVEFTAPIESKKFDVLLLSQMDYILSDRQLRHLINFSYNADIQNIMVLSPSIHSIITARNPLLIMRNILDLILDLLASIRSFKHYSSCLYSRRRLFFKFTLFFKDLYKLKSKIIYQYPYGRMHLLHYVKSTK